jgi:hypothetical protein
VGIAVRVSKHALLCVLALIPGGPIAASDSTGCNSVTPLPRADGVSIVRSDEAGAQQKNWQPQGGEIEYTVKSIDTIPSDATFLVCFRWKDDHRQDGSYVQARPNRFDRSNDGKTLTLVTTVPRLGTKPEHVAHTAVGTVPLADVRILAVDASDHVSADVMTTIGITDVRRAALIALITLFLALSVLWLITRERLGLGKIEWRRAPLYVISTPDGRASLSQLQILLWVFVIGASATYVMALSGNLIQVTTGTLVLLGISGTATLGAKLDSTRKDSREAADKPPALPAPAPAPQVPPQSVLPREPRWSDLVAVERLNAQKQLRTEVDVARVQMLYFTLITAAFVVLRVLTTYVIPEIPDGFQILMGISNGVYLGSKAVEK